jgi:hypothetical protein
VLIPVPLTLAGLIRSHVLICCYHSWQDIEAGVKPGRKDPQYEEEEEEEESGLSWSMIALSILFVGLAAGLFFLYFTNKGSRGRSSLPI